MNKLLVVVSIAGTLMACAPEHPDTNDTKLKPANPSYSNAVPAPVDHKMNNSNQNV